MIHRHLGVRYIYKDDADSSAPQISEKDRLKALTPEALGALPPELLRNLQKVVLRGESDSVERLIDDIRSHDAALADALAVLVDDFDYGKILESIKKAGLCT